MLLDKKVLNKYASKDILLFFGSVILHFLKEMIIKIYLSIENVHILEF